tara:strand:- start:458 stop:724 length:267 start_codon:yes stop_codon:yes gene_type:complete
MKYRFNLTKKETTMEVTIVQNMPIPKATNGRGGAGSKYDAILEQASVGDCIQFKGINHQRYFCKLLKRRGHMAATRKHNGLYCVWITA